MNWKRIVTRTAIISAVLAVIGLGVGRLFMDQWYRFESVPDDPTGPIVELIQSSGFGPAGLEAVHNLELHAGVRYVYVADSNRTILAANPPTIEGGTVTALIDSLVENHLQGVETPAAAPDGQLYGVGFAMERPHLPDQVGSPVFIAGLAAAFIAWVALAAWIYLDAQSSGKATAMGWGLLGLFAAPLALAIWIISRRGQEPVEPTVPVCPGCGADVPKDVTFCVRCGHGLRPTCPDCRRPVETDWTYCGACGANLSE